MIFWGVAGGEQRVWSLKKWIYYSLSQQRVQNMGIKKADLERVGFIRRGSEGCEEDFEGLYSSERQLSR